jgi:hypothetical protein
MRIGIRQVTDSPKNLPFANVRPPMDVCLSSAPTAGPSACGRMSAQPFLQALGRVLFDRSEHSLFGVLR